MKTNSAKTGNKHLNWWFLGAVVAVYLIILFISPRIFHASIQRFGPMFLKVVPVLVGVFSVMFLVNWLYKPKNVKQHLGSGSGLKGLGIAVLAGILSTGPIYVWYPLLAELRQKGMSNFLVTIFLYNRAVKVHLLPLMVYYFGLRFAVVLTLVMIFFSIFDGWLVDKILASGRKEV